MFADQTVELLPARTTMQVAIAGGGTALANSSNNVQVIGLGQNNAATAVATGGQATNFQVNILSAFNR